LASAREQRRRVSLIGLGLVIIAFLIAVGTLIPIREWNRLAALRDNGARASAHVVKTEADITGRRAADVIHYEFQPAQGPSRTGVLRLIRGRSQPIDFPELTRQFYEGTLIVRYSPENPDDFALEAWLPEKIERVRIEVMGYGALAGLLGLVGIALAVWGLPAWRSRRR
jgi:hypothetical protein